MYANFVKLSDIRAGSKVMVRGAFGREPAVLATVEDVLDDIKNGYPGIDYTGPDGDGSWAYLNQVDRVVQY